MNAVAKTPRINRRPTLEVAAVVALVVGFLDVSQSVLTHARVLSDFAQILPPLAAMTATAFVVCWVALAIVVPLGRARGLDAPALAVALGMMLATLFLLVTTLELRFSPTNAVRYFLFGVVAMVVCVGAYAYCVRSTLTRSARVWAAGIGLVSPWMAGALMVFLWFVVLRVRSPWSGGALVAAVLLVVAVGLVGWVGVRTAGSAWLRRAVAVLLAVVLVAPAYTVLSGRRSAAPANAAGHDVRHVFLIVVDTLRRDALSCYGAGGIETPNIDRLAADGVTFLNAVSPSSWTLPSMCSMMSGLAPVVHGAIQYKQALHDSVETVADLLRRDGYATTAIGSNPMLSPAYNLEQGFDDYQWYPRPSDDTSVGKRILLRVFPAAYRADLSTEELSDAAIAWAEVHRDQDAFLWLHYFDPHHPYSPPERFLPDRAPPPGMGAVFEDRKGIQAGLLAPSAAEREWIRSLYLGEVRYVDEQLGRFIEALERLGMYEESLIIVTSDHGEEFWEHGGFEHGHTLYRELLAVPLIVKPPRWLAGGARVPSLVGTQAVAATILDVCGVTYDPAYMVAPLSLDAQGLADDHEARPVFSGGLRYYENRWAVTTDRYKYIFSSVSRSEQLFDRVGDAAEQRPLGTEAMPTLLEARGTLDEHLRRAGEARDYLRIKDRWQADLDPETIRRLKALGYL